MLKNDEAKLSISSNNIKKCSDIVKILLDLKVLSKVTSNESIVKYNDNYKIERGCTINIMNIETNNIKEIWRPLQKKFNLNCAHLEIPGKFNGCIKKFLK
jgi:hypothetical protein